MALHTPSGACQKKRRKQVCINVYSAMHCSMFDGFIILDQCFCFYCNCTMQCQCNDVTATVQETITTQLHFTLPTTNINSTITFSVFLLTKQSINLGKNITYLATFIMTIRMNRLRGRWEIDSEAEQ